MKDLVFADAGLAVFEARIIFKAQPPVSDAEIARLEASLCGPIPPDLVALWKICYGGRLDYDLDVAFGEHIRQFNFGELFYPGSCGYNDLDGWIADERNLEMLQSPAQSSWIRRSASRVLGRRGATTPPKLELLPFGGFEYLDCLYVRVTENDYGAVYAYSEGILPARSLRLHESSFARIADSVRGLFRALYLERNPFTAARDSFTHGMDAIDAIAQARLERKAGASDAGVLEAILTGAIADWHTALKRGTLSSDRRLARLALEHAVETGNWELLQRLEEQGMDPARPLTRGGNLLDHFLLRGQFGVANALLDRGLRPDEWTLQCAPDAAPALVHRLREAGAAPNQYAVLNAVRAGYFDNAELMARWLLEQDRDTRDLLLESCYEGAVSNELSAVHIEQTQMGSDGRPASYREEAQRLRDFASWLETL